LGESKKQFENRKTRVPVPTTVEKAKERCIHAKTRWGGPKITECVLSGRSEGVVVAGQSKPIVRKCAQGVDDCQRFQAYRTWKATAAASCRVFVSTGRRYQGEEERTEGGRRKSRRHSSGFFFGVGEGSVWRWSGREAGIAGGRTGRGNRTRPPAVIFCERGKTFSGRTGSHRGGPHFACHKNRAVLGGLFSGMATGSVKQRHRKTARG
jgi:hypothetical protein